MTPMAAPSRALLSFLSSHNAFVCQRCLRQARNQLVPVFRKLHTDSSTTPPPTTIPFRKKQKDNAKAARLSGTKASLKKSRSTSDPKISKYELTIGIEIHAQLNTANKLFSSAHTSLAAAPNTHVAPFDAAIPGAQPTFQKATLLPAIRAALALGCEIRRVSRWDRKHYFYADQPQGYQVTQFYVPFAVNGQVILRKDDGIDPGDGEEVVVGVKQVQMEQDTAKTLAGEGRQQLLDLNRVGHPLVEIVSLPVMHSPKTAAAYVRKVQGLLRAVDSNVVGMEMGGLRADVNVSVKLRDNDDGAATNEYAGVKNLGTRTEIKNLSSFKAVEEAIIAERNRQISVLEAGGIIEGETRGWTIGNTETRKLRGKEGEVDYRYMPDPDLGPVIIGDDLLSHLRDTLPPLPDEDISFLMTEPLYKLSAKDARMLASMDDGARMDYYMDVVAAVHEIFSFVSPEQPIDTQKIGKTAANYTIHELPAALAPTSTPWDENPVPADVLAAIVAAFLQSRVTGRSAKALLLTVVAERLDPVSQPRSVDQIIEQESLELRPMSEDEYVELASVIVEENPSMAEQARAKGGEGKVMWFVGQMMRRGEDGRVQAERAGPIVRNVLGLGE